MLVLSRRGQESILIGDSIVVTVLKVAGDKVRLGIQAPPETVILRDELKTTDRFDVPILKMPTVDVQGTASQSC